MAELLVVRSKIKNCSSPYQYNKLLEDFVGSKEFVDYFKEEDFLEVYTKFRVNQNLTSLDYKLNSTFLLSFFKETNSGYSNRKTEEIVKEFEKKRKELENKK